MYFGAIQICGERIGSSETKDFCEALDAHKIKMLSLRECGISTKNFKKIMVAIGYCKSIMHLNLNLCGINAQDRVELLAAALNINRSLTALLLHGNHFGTEGAAKIVRSLILHPHITCLDAGDCDLGDKALKHICGLLPTDSNKPGLQELVLSGNPRITPRAWEKLTLAVSVCSSLKALYIDFNLIGETAGKMMIVAAAGHKSLSVLDMEACGLSESVGRLLLHVLQHYPTSLCHVLLEENGISEETKYAIRLAMGESESEPSSEDELEERQEQSQQSSRHEGQGSLIGLANESDEIAKAIVEVCTRAVTEASKSTQNRNRKLPSTAITAAEQEGETQSDDGGEISLSTNITLRSKHGHGHDARCNDSANSKSKAIRKTLDEFAAQSDHKAIVPHKPSPTNRQPTERAVAEADYSDEELPAGKKGLDVTYEFCAHEPSCAHDKVTAKCNVKQDTVQRDGRQFLRIHGDCEGGSVKVRVRSQSRDSSTRKERSLDSGVNQLNAHKEREMQSEEPGRSCSKSPGRTKPKRHMKVKATERSKSRARISQRHRANLGLASAEQWSDDDDYTVFSRSSRGPWCGSGTPKGRKFLTHQETSKNSSDYSELNFDANSQPRMNSQRLSSITSQRLPSVVVNVEESQQPHHQTTGSKVEVVAPKTIAQTGQSLL